MYKVTIQDFIEYIGEWIKQCDESWIDWKDVAKAYVKALQNYKSKDK